MSESLDEQIERLAVFIMEHMKGEPSESGGAVDCAIRLLRERSSWVPSERVETIDCKRCGGRGEFLQSVSGEHGHYTTQPCPLCTRSAGGSGKLQIVTKETTP